MWRTSVEEERGHEGGDRHGPCPRVLTYPRPFTLIHAFSHALTELQEEMRRQKGEAAGHVQAGAWAGVGNIGRDYL